MNTTEVFSTTGNWNRTAYIKFVGDKVVFDCSDEEYGPIEFDLEILETAIQHHKKKVNNKSWLEQIRKYTIPST